MARRQRTEATVLVRGAALARLKAHHLDDRPFASVVTRTSTVTECAKGWAARFELCAANSARAVAALH